MAFAQFVERVEVEARQLNPRRAALTVVAAVLFAVGWIIGAVFRFVWAVISWSITAAKVGFQTGRGTRRVT